MRTWCFAAIAVVMVASSVFPVSKELCELTFTGCPNEHDGQTVTIPDNIIRIHAEVKHCPPPLTFVDVQAPAPSIVFVIDHSASMGNTDPTTARFEVTKQLLDEIYKQNPRTDVGIVVFSNRLVYDARDNEFFKRITLSPADMYYDSYVPLTRLDNTATGINKLKWALTTKVVTADSEQVTILTNATTRASPRVSHPAVRFDARYPGATDITLGFQAAKEALSASTATPERRFIIFLSDGGASNVDSLRLKTIRDFVKGTAVPTTFTIWFGAKANKDLDSMTQHIRTNGYSSNNPRSNLWSIASPRDELLGLVKSEVLTQIFSKTANPVLATVKGVENVSYTDSSFVFSKPFPFGNASDTVSMVFNYKYYNPVAKDTGDTVIRSSFIVKRSATATLPSWMGKLCWTREIDLVYQGAAVSAVTPGMDQLTVRLRGDMEIAPGSVEISAPGTSDRLSGQMTKSGTEYVYSFTRQVGTANRADNVLQHSQVDSIVVFWWNPDMPLDTMRFSVPYLYRKLDRPYTNKPPRASLPVGNMSTPYDTTYTRFIDGAIVTNDSLYDTIWLTTDGSMPVAGKADHRYNGNALASITAEELTITAFATRAQYISSDTMRVRYIRMYLRATVGGAEYYDTDANGIIDKFTLTVANPGELNIDSVRAHPEAIGLPAPFTIKSITAGQATGTIDIVVAQSDGSRQSGSKQVTITDKPYKGDGFLAAGTITAIDKAGPIILSAKYLIQAGPKRTKIDDTLVVEFSESIELVEQQSRVSPFQLYWTDNNNTMYKMVLEPMVGVANNTVRFLVREVSSGQAFPLSTDSIGIIPGQIADQSGTVQDNPSNKKRSLDVVYPPFDMRATAGPNPVDLNKGNRPSFPKEYIADPAEAGGALFVVTPAWSTSPEIVRNNYTHALADVYDAVGNMIRKDLRSTVKDGAFYLAWNARNESGRVVGSGTYTALITMYRNSEARDTYRVKIGIKN